MKLNLVLNINFDKHVYIINSPRMV